jgi:hypothetical protein
MQYFLPHPVSITNGTNLSDSGDARWQVHEIISFETRLLLTSITIQFITYSNVISTLANFYHLAPIDYHVETDIISQKQLTVHATTRFHANKH